MPTQHRPIAGSPSRPRARPLRRGFTLIEAALTTVIIGTGVLSIVAAQQAYTQKNDWAQRTAMGMTLANEVRELMLSLPLHDPITGVETLGPEAGEQDVSSYDDVDDFAGVVVSGVGNGMTFSPPVNALRQTIPDLPGWSQHVDVENVLEDNISTTFTQPLGTTDMVRVTVTVNYQSPQAASPMVMASLVFVMGP